MIFNAGFMARGRFKPLLSQSLRSPIITRNSKPFVFYRTNSMASPMSLLSKSNLSLLMTPKRTMSTTSPDPAPKKEKEETPELSKWEDALIKSFCVVCFITLGVAFPMIFVYLFLIGAIAICFRFPFVLLLLLLFFLMLYVFEN